MNKRRIFISYKREDKNIVFKIKNDIEKFIGVKCWIDFDGIESDAQFVNVIIKAIDEADIFLFVYSKLHTKIVNFDTDWTIREINYAQAKRKRIIFLNIDNTPLSDWFIIMFGLKQQVDVHSNLAMQKLYADLLRWLELDEISIPKKTEKREDKMNGISEKIKIVFKHKFFKTGCYIAVLGLVIIGITGIVAKYNQNKNSHYEQRQMEHEIAVTNFTRFLNNSGTDSIINFQTALYWLNKIDSIDFDDNAYGSYKVDFTNRLDSIYIKLKKRCERSLDIDLEKEACDNLLRLEDLKKKI